MATAYISHPVFKEHKMSEDHPDSPRRLTSIEDRLQAEGLMDLLNHYEAPLASRAQLERVHSHAHIEDLAARAPAYDSVQIQQEHLYHYPVVTGHESLSQKLKIC